MERRKAIAVAGAASFTLLAGATGLAINSGIVNANHDGNVGKLSPVSSAAASTAGATATTVGADVPLVGADHGATTTIERAPDVRPATTAPVATSSASGTSGGNDERSGDDDRSEDDGRHEHEGADDDD